MNTHENALRVALKAIEAQTSDAWICNSDHPLLRAAIPVLREALAAQPKREAVKLDPFDLNNLAASAHETALSFGLERQVFISFARAIESAVLKANGLLP